MEIIWVAAQSTLKISLPNYGLLLNICFHLGEIISGENERMFFVQLVYVMCARKETKGVKKVRCSGLCLFRRHLFTLKKVGVSLWGKFYPFDKNALFIHSIELLTRNNFSKYKSVFRA